MVHQNLNNREIYFCKKATEIAYCFMHYYVFSLFIILNVCFIVLYFRMKELCIQIYTIILFSSIFSVLEKKMVCVTCVGFLQKRDYLLVL